MGLLDSLLQEIPQHGLPPGQLQAPLSSSPLSRAGDQATHTGQKFDESDPRYVRFAVSGVAKQVNPQWSEKLIQEVPVIKVAKRIVSCDGGGGALGHPTVFINLDPKGPKACPYCGLRYEYHPHADEEEEEHH